MVCDVYNIGETSVLLLYFLEGYFWGYYGMFYVIVILSEFSKRFNFKRHGMQNSLTCKNVNTNFYDIK